MENISSNSSLPLQLNTIIKSFVLTEPLESVSHSDVICSSPILASSSTSTCIGYKISDQAKISKDSLESLVLNEAAKNVKRVDVGTRTDAQTLQQPAHMPTAVQVAGQIHIPQPNAKSRQLELWTTHPRYLRNLVWPEEEPSSLPSALSTLHTEPVPTPPLNELTNHVTLHTIQQHPSLFTIITPINVDRFESYLKSHPNRSHVQSVCRALREGFWPWAITNNPDLPVTWDNSYRPLKEQAHVQFV
jgi:hypothetical protein